MADSGRIQDPPRPLTREPRLSNKQQFLLTRSQRAGLVLAVYDSPGASWIKNVVLPSWEDISCIDASADCLLSAALAALGEHQTASVRGDQDRADQLLFIAIDLLNSISSSLPNERGHTRSSALQARDAILANILSQPIPTTPSAVNLVAQQILAITEVPTELSEDAQQQILSYLPSLLSHATGAALQVLLDGTVLFPV